MFRPFPGDLLGEILKGRKGVAVLERVDQPLADDLPLMREVRATLAAAWRTVAPPTAPAVSATTPPIESWTTCRRSIPAPSASAAATCNRKA